MAFGRHTPGLGTSIKKIVLKRFKAVLAVLSSFVDWQAQDGFFIAIHGRRVEDVGDLDGGSKAAGECFGEQSGLLCGRREVGCKHDRFDGNANAVLNHWHMGASQRTSRSWLNGT